MPSTGFLRLKFSGAALHAVPCFSPLTIRMSYIFGSLCKSPSYLLIKQTITDTTSPFDGGRTRLSRHSPGIRPVGTLPACVEHWQSAHREAWGPDYLPTRAD